MKIRRGNSIKLSEDQLLWLFFETSEEQYAGRLFLRRLPVAFGYCLAQLGDRKSCMEALSGFYEAMPEKLTADSEKVASFAGWLPAAMREYIGQYRADLQEKGAKVPAQRAVVCLSPAAAACARAFASDAAKLREAVAEKHSTLTKPQSNCMEMFFGRGMSFSDIAHATGYLISDARIHVLAGVENVAAGQSAAPPPKEERVDEMSYVKGERSGLHARDVELKALCDPFLCEALMGYDMFPHETDDNLRAVGEVRGRIRKAASVRRMDKRTRMFVGAAVSAIVVIALCLVFLSTGADDSDSAAAGAKSNVSAVDSGDAATDATTDATPDDLTQDAGADAVDAETPTENDAEPVGDEPHGEDMAQIEAASGEDGGQKIESSSAEDKPEARPAPEESADAPAEQAVTPTAPQGPIFHVAPPTDEQIAALPEGSRTLSSPTVGKRRFEEYLRKAITLPADGSTGDVTISFHVNRYGRPSKMRVESSFHKEAGQEAIRLLHSGPEWTPTEERVHVTIYFR